MPTYMQIKVPPPLSPAEAGKILKKILEDEPLYTIILHSAYETIIPETLMDEDYIYISLTADDDEDIVAIITYEDELAKYMLQDKIETLSNILKKITSHIT